MASSATVGYYGAKITSADDSSNKETDLDDEDIFIDQRHAIQVHIIYTTAFPFLFSIKFCDILCFVKDVKFSPG